MFARRTQIGVGGLVEQAVDTCLYAPLFLLQYPLLVCQSYQCRLGAKHILLQAQAIGVLGGNNVFQVTDELLMGSICGQRLLGIPKLRPQHPALADQVQEQGVIGITHYLSLGCSLFGAQVQLSRPGNTLADLENLAHPQGITKVTGNVITDG